MNAKTVFSTALVWTVVSLGAAHAQTPGAMNPLDTLPSPANSSAPPREPAPLTPAQKYSVSNWIRGDQYGCCDGVGGDGPIQTDLFFRVGAAVPIGNIGQVANVLQTGLYLGAGGRVLFFDPSMDSAWTVELGITNISNHAHAGNAMALNIFVPQNDPTGTLPPVRVFFGRDPGVPGVTLQQLNRTYFDVGPGKEWYLWGSARDSRNWRIGIDGGGRYGSERAEFHEIRHRSDVIAGLWASVHSDIEFPLCGCCVFQAGVRVEYGYTWSDIMQIQNNSDVQELNFLFSVGIRY